MQASAVVPASRTFSKDPLRDVRQRNAASLERELDWCVAVMDARLEQYFAADEDPNHQLDIHAVAPPAHAPDESDFARALCEWELTFDERIVLAIALIPHVRPQALDLFFLQNKTLGRPYTEFGGWKGKVHGGFLPTCETVSWVLAGRELARRLEVQRILESEHLFFEQRVLRVEPAGAGEPFWGGALHITSEFLSRFTSGEVHKPDFSAEFPAKRITSKLSWADVVLDPEVREDLAHIETWLKKSEQVMCGWGLEKNIKPGYRCLFYGPPGTGKTLTATLIGASCGLDVYRIDLSMVVSKYIGETEKNLSRVFDEAETKNWVLFFDEADALFGKRTATKSSNDRFANQEVSYLLQRIEDCPNVVVLATNTRSNIDDAFYRRFQSVVHFPMPGPEQRLQLWQRLFSDPTILGPDVNLPALAEQYELSGGALTNIVRFAALRAVRLGRENIVQQDLVIGIRKERTKEGKFL